MRVKLGIIASDDRHRLTKEFEIGYSDFEKVVSAVNYLSRMGFPITLKWETGGINNVDRSREGSN